MKQNCAMVGKLIVGILSIFFMSVFYGCGSSDISTVKKSSFEFDKGITFGDAIDKYAYFESTKWESLKNDKNRKIVQVTGKIKKDNLNKLPAEIKSQDIEIIIQCSINLDGKSFELSYVGAKVLTSDCGLVDAQGDSNWIPSIYKDEEALVDQAASKGMYECDNQKQIFVSSAEKGDLTEIKKFFSSGMNVNAKNENGDTALMAASMYGKFNIVKELLAKGADVNAKTEGGDTALMLASGSDKRDIVKELLAKGADINAKNQAGDTALMAASMLDNPDMVKELITGGADVNAKNEAGDTALMLASDSVNPDMVKELLANGADANAINIKGETAWTSSIDANGYTVRRLLTENRNNLVLSKEGKTVNTSAPDATEGNLQAQEPPAPHQSESPSVAQSDICNGLDISIDSEHAECLDRKYAAADKELNSIYKQIRSGLDASRKSELKKEQIAWIKEKESKCAQAGKENEGGTLERVMIMDCLVQMTEQRILYLKNFK